MTRSVRGRDAETRDPPEYRSSHRSAAVRRRLISLLSQMVLPHLKGASVDDLGRQTGGMALTHGSTITAKPIGMLRGLHAFEKYCYGCSNDGLSSINWRDRTSPR